MTTRNLSKRITGLILGFTILLCVGLGASATGNAQDRNWDRYGNYGGSAQLRQAALNAGCNYAKPDERSNPSFNPVPRRPHLDVDAVLARSLPKLTGE